MSLFSRDIVYSPTEMIGEYTVLKRIGEGRFGICYLVQYGLQQMILKQLRMSTLKKSGDKIGFEQEILIKLQHDCIPRFIKKVTQERFYGYALEYKEGKTFEELIFVEKRVFKREEIFDIGKQMIRILKYLHGNGVVHRDIRIPNTLYANGNLYLVDFGLARYINNDRYCVDIDFSYLGDFLLHLYYTSFEIKGKKKPWYEELELIDKELIFLKKLMGLEHNYTNIQEVEVGFLDLYS